MVKGIKSNRIIALLCKDKKLGKFQQISSLYIQDGESKKVWLKCVSFEVLLIKKVFINEDGSTSILYLASNDTEHDAAYLYEIYQKRWRIEEYHNLSKKIQAWQNLQRKRYGLKQTIYLLQ